MVSPTKKSASIAHLPQARVNERERRTANPMSLPPLVTNHLSRTFVKVSRRATINM